MKRWIRNLHTEGGAVLITVALASLVVFGMVAVGVDGSRMYNERRHAQNAADEAALAGAWARCQGGSVGTAALASAAANGFDNDGVTNTVDVNHPYSGDPNQVEVVISSTMDASFAAVIGFDDMSVAARAVGICDLTGGGVGVAIFAGSHTCGTDTLKSTGSSTTVNGGLHSNDDLHLNSAHTAITGPATYTGSSTGNGVPPQAARSGFQDYPVTFQLSDYAPGGERANAAQAAGEYHYFPHSITNTDLGLSPGHGGVVDTGLYYVQGTVDVNKVSGDATFVSTGSMKLNNNNTPAGLSAYEPSGLVLFSNHPGSPSCGAVAIEFSGAHHEWVGIVYAPNGGVKFSASGNSTIWGSVVAHTVDISGASLSVNYDPAADGTRKPTVQLEH